MIILLCRQAQSVIKKEIKRIKLFKVNTPYHYYPTLESLETRVDYVFFFLQSIILTE